MRARHPLVPSQQPRPQHFRPGQRLGGTDGDAPSALPVEGCIPREHIEVPQRETGGHGRGAWTGGRRVLGPTVGVHCDGPGEFEEAEVRGEGLGPQADADELDLGDEEAVAAVVLAEEELQVGEAVEVFDVVEAVALALAGVPALVGFDQADDAGVGGEGAGFLVGLGGDEVGAAVFGGAEGHDVVLVALGEVQGGVDFGNVEIFDGVGEGGEVLWAGGGGAEGGWCRETGRFDVDVEEGGQAGDGGDDVQVEVIPRADVADVPPEVFGSRIVAAATADHASSDGEDGGVRFGQVSELGGGCVEIIAFLEDEVGRQSASRGWIRGDSHRQGNKVVQRWWYHGRGTLRRVMGDVHGSSPVERVAGEADGRGIDRGREGSAMAKVSRCVRGREGQGGLCCRIHPGAQCRGGRYRRKLGEGFRGARGASLVAWAVGWRCILYRGVVRLSPTM